jgi:RNA polymerase sigma-70 factor, ECF subfamily
MKIPRVKRMNGSAASAKRETVRKSSEQALQRVYREHVGRIYRYIYLRIRNHEDAEDVTADVFLKAVSELDCDRAPKEIRYWLFQVARTTLADHWRTHAQLFTRSLEEMLEWEREESLEIALLPNKSGRTTLLQRQLLAHFVTGSPEDHLETDEEVLGDEARTTSEANAPQLQVQCLLQALPDPYRAVLTCRFLLNLSVRDTALRLGLTQANVKVVQYRALKRAAACEDSIIPKLKGKPRAMPGTNQENGT